jgi:hypothetical protein
MKYGAQEISYYTEKIVRYAVPSPHSYLGPTNKIPGNRLTNSPSLLYIVISAWTWLRTAGFSHQIRSKWPALQRMVIQLRPPSNLLIRYFFPITFNYCMPAARTQYNISSYSPYTPGKRKRNTLCSQPHARTFLWKHGSISHRRMNTRKILKIESTNFLIIT